MIKTQANGCRTPEHHQLALLDLDFNQHLPLVGKRVLDLCCGDGTLVRKLRDLGVTAEGIDQDAPREADFFMCQKVGDATWGGANIPRSEGYYNLVISFQNPVFNEAFINRLFLTLCPYQKTIVLKDAEQMILEISRILTMGSRAIIYPSLPDLKERAGDLLIKQQLAVSFNTCDSKKVESYHSWKAAAEARKINDHLRGMEELFYQTILQKE